MKNLKWIFIAALIVLSPASISQTIIYYSSATITEINVYATFGNGDVEIHTSADTGDCSNGFWFNASDPGYAVVMSAALAALRDGSTIGIEGDKDDRWAGSGGNYCHLWQLKVH